MKVLLATVINPKYKHQIIPDVGIGYLASSARKAGHEVIYYNGLIHNQIPEFESYLSKNLPDIVGFKVFFGDMIYLKDCIGIVKKQCPQATIVVGGPHPSCIREEIMKIKGIDFAFHGEAEVGFPMLLDVLDGKLKRRYEDIPGLIWHQGSRIIVNPKMFIENLDSLEMPAWDLINPHENAIDQYGFSVKSYPTAPIITTRGCPFECTYCSAKLVSGRRVRHRGIDQVIREIVFLKNRYGIKEFTILDDNFTADKKYTLEFCKKVKRQKIFWTCPQGVRLDCIDEGVLMAMKDAGCYSFGVGIESGSQGVLNHMKKRLTVPLIKDKINLIKRCGIKVQGFFIIGFPGETMEDLKKTEKLASSLPLYRLFFSIFTPYPGTEIYEELKEKKLLPDSVIYDYNSVSVPLSDIPISKLKRIQRMAILRFYLKPRVFLEILSTIRKPHQIKYLFNQVNEIILKR